MISNESEISSVNIDATALVTQHDSQIADDLRESSRLSTGHYLALSSLISFATKKCLQKNVECYLIAELRQRQKRRM